MTGYLNPADRPKALTKAIDDSFQKLANQTSSGWGFKNGKEEYEFAGLSTHQSIIQMIKDRSATQKTFYVMDIGAGEFQWGRALAEKINQAGFDSDIQVHIIGLRGEQNPNAVEQELGLCVLHEAGAFKVEELETEIQTLRLGDLNNKIDFMVSSFCFMHLQDKIGSFVQAHNLLRPETGIFVLDGFLEIERDFAPVDKAQSDFGWTVYMEELLYNCGSPFFTLQDRTAIRSNVFVMKKENDTPLKLPLNYKEDGSLTRLGNWIFEPNPDAPKETRDLVLEQLGSAVATYWGQESLQFLDDMLNNMIAKTPDQSIDTAMEFKSTLTMVIKGLGVLDTMERRDARAMARLISEKFTGLFSFGEDGILVQKATEDQTISEMALVQLVDMLLDKNSGQSQILGYCRTLTEAMGEHQDLNHLEAIPAISTAKTSLQFKDAHKAIRGQNQEDNPDSMLHDMPKNR